MKAEDLLDGLGLCLVMVMVAGLLIGAPRSEQEAEEMRLLLLLGASGQALILRERAGWLVALLILCGLLALKA